MTESLYIRKLDIHLFAFCNKYMCVYIININKDIFKSKNLLIFSFSLLYVFGTYLYNYIFTLNVMYVLFNYV